MVICMFKRGTNGINGVVLAKKLEEINYTAVFVSDGEVLTDKDGNPFVDRGYTDRAVADRIRSFRKDGYEVTIKKCEWKSAFNS